MAVMASAYLASVAVRSSEVEGDKAAQATMTVVAVEVIAITAAAPVRSSGVAGAKVGEVAVTVVAAKLTPVAVTEAPATIAALVW